MVRVEVDGHIIIITLDRPEVRNAVNGELSRGVEAAIDRLEEEENLWVGILAAEGPVFCAGADLKEISEGRGRTIGTERGGLLGLVRRERTTQERLHLPCSGRCSVPRGQGRNRRPRSR